MGAVDILVFYGVDHKFEVRGSNFDIFVLFAGDRVGDIAEHNSAPQLYPEDLFIRRDLPAFGDHRLEYVGIFPVSRSERSGAERVEAGCESGVDNTCGCRFTKQFGKLPVGYDHKYVYSHFGFNLKVTDMQAAIGCAQLDKLPAFTEARKTNFAVLYDGLKDLKELQLFEKYPESDPAWFGFLITLTEKAHFSRNDLVKHLEDCKIQTRNLFAGNLLKHPCFETLHEGVDYRVAGSLVNTDKIMNDSFWIGVYPGMTREKLYYMVSAIRNFIRENK